MRDQSLPFHADVPDAMGIDDITLEDLAASEPALMRSTAPLSFKQLLKDGLPLHCGLEGLAAIEGLPDPGTQLTDVRRGYLQLLALQRRGV
jgi:hypothetical protein